MSHEDQVLVYPKKLQIPRRKKHSTMLLTLLLLLLTVLLLYVGIELMAPEESSSTNPSGEEQTDSLEKDTPSLETVHILTKEKDPDSAKYAFRSAWLPSVLNLDYPSASAMTIQELKDSFHSILDVYELYKLNAVIMQVRPTGDALYFSELNPPSVFVTGDLEKGLPMDLLAFAIDAVHARGMEFHAWFNPFRVTVYQEPEKTTEEILEDLHEINYARLHPEHVLRFDHKLFLDPGQKEVQAFVLDSIMEVVRNYDIDAVHLDDYFYPYRSTRENEEGELEPYFFGDDEEDLRTYLTHRGDFQDIKEWRRDNTYQFMKDLHTAIHDQKPYVKLGLSPFGIWGHADETGGLGSSTPVSSSESYHHSVFLDTKKLIEEELIDYVVPQIYWTFEEEQAPFGVLARWWDQVVADTKVDLYIGHGNYKIHEAQGNPFWQNTTVLKDQLAYTSTLPNVRGSVFFRFAHLVAQDSSFTATTRAFLEANNAAIRAHFHHVALIPRNRNLPSAKATEPKDFTLKNGQLKFKDGYEGFSEMEKTSYFILYQFPKEDLNPENPAYIYKKIPVKSTGSTYTFNHLNTTDYVYGLSAFNRLHDESPILLPVED